MISCSRYLVCGGLTDKVALDLFESIGISYNQQSDDKVEMMRRVDDWIKSGRAECRAKQRGR
jgi:hypothetical protein